MRSERQALADIAKLCDNHEGTFGDGVLDTDEVRAILADVQPEPAPAGDDVLMPPETLLERVKADGRLWKAGVAAGRQDAPVGGTIDRDALIAAQRQTGEDPDESADRILALVRPVEGVLLSREDVGRVLDWYYAADPSTPFDHDDRALAKQLEAAS